MHVQILKRMGKVLSDSCVPKAKMFNFELLVPSKIQLQKKRNSISAKNDLLFTQLFIVYHVLENSMRIC